MQLVQNRFVKHCGIGLDKPLDRRQISDHSEVKAQNIAPELPTRSLGKGLQAIF
jgi:hypothetical protein